MIESCIDDRTALTYLSESQTQPASTRIGMKSHSMIFLKPAPDPIGMQTKSTNVRIRPAIVGLSVDTSEQLTQPWRWGSFRLDRTAPLAGSETGGQCFMSSREKLQLVLARCPG